MIDSLEKKSPIDPKDVISEIEADTTARLERAEAAKETKQVEEKEAEKTPIRKIIQKIAGKEELQKIEAEIAEKQRKKTDAPN